MHVSEQQYVIRFMDSILIISDYTKSHENDILPEFKNVYKWKIYREIKFKEDCGYCSIQRDQCK